MPPIFEPSALGDLSTTADLRELISASDQALTDLQSIGPFSAEVEEELRRAFLPSRISDTLNIEGVRVNPRITLAVLEGTALAEADRYNEREILNVIDANTLIEAEAQKQCALSLELIREVHRRTMAGLVDSAGAFRTKDVRISGAAVTPPAWADVAPAVGQLCDAVASNSVLHPLPKAAWVHATLAGIHPFDDGNGRTARLLQDFILVSAGFLPVGVPASRRQEYYDSLERADDRDFIALVEIICNAQLTALDTAKQIATAPAKRRERVRKLVAQAQRTAKQTDYNKYSLWRRRIDLLLGEFSRWVEDLNTESGDLAVAMKVYDPLSFEQWSEIRKTGRARATWLFRLTLRVRGQALYSFLFYARRHEFSYTLEFEEMERGTVGVFLTGAEPPEFRFEFGRFDDPYIRLRELLFRGGVHFVNWGQVLRSTYGVRRLADGRMSVEWTSQKPHVPPPSGVAADDDWERLTL